MLELEKEKGECLAHWSDSVITDFRMVLAGNWIITNNKFFSYLILYHYYPICISLVYY